MTIGFTGTRNPITDQQRLGLIDEFQKAYQRHSSAMSGSIILRHGDCVGADAAAHMICRDCCPRCIIIIHAPENPCLRANCQGDEERPRRNYLARNRDIVNESDELWACPPTNEWMKKGGTFYTIAYAKKLGKPIVIFWPDGRVERIAGKEKA